MTDQEKQPEREHDEGYEPPAVEELQHPEDPAVTATTKVTPPADGGTF